MGYRHSEKDILEAAVRVVLKSGMSELTFGKVAQELDINDRTVVYYFPTKADLVTAVAQDLAGSFLTLLDKAFGPEPRGPAELIARAWPVLTTPAADRTFALYFEIVGLASARQTPYDVLARAMVDGWVDWLIPRTTGSTIEIRRNRALATVAQIDGLLLLRRIVGKTAANAAARELGLTPAPRKRKPT